MSLYLINANACAPMKSSPKEITKIQSALRLISDARFCFRTLAEAENISIFVSELFSESTNIQRGLAELMINAVEHGNLGITYEEKSKLVMDGSWLDEIERRLTLPKNADKFAQLTLKQYNGMVSITIEDCGQGFDWQKYMKLRPDHIDAPNGRGIAIAKISCFDSLEFMDPGNSVVCTKLIN